MKKRNVINLIRYHSERNEAAFRAEALTIAREFDKAGDAQLAEYIMALLSDANTFVPQMDETPCFLSAVGPAVSALPLPEAIASDISGITNAIRGNVGVNKFLFQGPPGTGKTEAAKQIARILNRDMFMVDFDLLIDSKLGQTGKNIDALFSEISSFRHPERAIVLFDEIDALALDRSSSNDVREMSRATSILLRELDRLDDSIALIATTNLFDSFDRALVRRFDACVNFDRYSQDDLVEIAEVIANELLPRFKNAGRDMRLFKKILSLSNGLPYPGDLRNMIKSAIAFSDSESEYDYLKRLYRQLANSAAIDVDVLKEQGFTVREMEKLTGISKSTLSRQLNGGSDE
ncbi:ATPase, AAA family [Slackia sp. CM382]|uniref:ATP-binding protein n=1 Tax=Slackia sp. CM382 TaxID=1111137 RepID=UPI00027C4D3F|nr:ATP-binding protein [Slackia sp. CM382]EJU32177.1 ATPase, AAA family [Slackia sp. CM382]